MNQELSVQLYTVREALTADLDDTLQRLAAIGFTQVEPYGIGDFPRLKAALDEAGLTAPTAHAHYIDTADRDLFSLAGNLGIEVLIDPYIPAERWRTRADIADIATRLNAAGRIARDFGVDVAYHNHAHELEIMVDGMTALEMFATYLEDHVNLQIDTYWVAVGGHDPVALLERLRDQVVAIHVKDGPPSANDKDQVAVGAGNMPIAEILRAAPQALHVIELDDSRGDRFQAVADSYQWMTTHAADVH